MDLLPQIVKDNRFTAEDLPKFEAKLFFEGTQRRLNFERFAVLLILSAIIATYGILGDSAATVIGAMIIAPLMKPIMATSAALVMGDMRRAAGSVVVVAVGVVATILIACVCAWVHPGVIGYSSSGQIINRISPSTIDLAVALASGAAGAFAMSRDDVADSLPGVAVSIALVPPLCVAGLGLAEGHWRVAFGSSVLFLTNFFSILLAGGAMLAILGLNAAATNRMNTAGRRHAFAAVIIGFFIVIIPLAYTSNRVANEALAEMHGKHLVRDWLKQSGLELNRIEAHGDEIEMLLSGDGDVPPLAELGERVRKVLDRQVTIKVIVVPTREMVLPGDPPQ